MKKCLYAMMVVMCLVCGTALAANHHFTGGVDGTGTDWNTGSNWDAGTVPVSDENVYVNPGYGSTTLTAILDTDGYCLNLQVGVGASTDGTYTLDINTGGYLHVASNYWASIQDCGFLNLNGGRIDTSNANFTNGTITINENGFLSLYNLAYAPGADITINAGGVMSLGKVGALGQGVTDLRGGTLAVYGNVTSSLGSLLNNKIIAYGGDPNYRAYAEYNSGNNRTYVTAGAAPVQYQFTGTIDTNWETAGNWNPNGVPGDIDFALIGRSATSNLTVDLNSDAYAKQIQLGRIGTDDPNYVYTLNVNGGGYVHAADWCTVGESGVLNVNGGQFVAPNVNFDQGQVNIYSGGLVAVTSGSGDWYMRDGTDITIHSGGTLALSGLASNYESRLGGGSTIDLSGGVFKVAGNVISQASTLIADDLFTLHGSTDVNDLTITYDGAYTYVAEVDDNLYNPADFNRSHIVNLVDFAVIAEDWLTTSLTSFDPAPGDTYEDFEYGNWLTMSKNGWYDVGDSEPIVSDRFSLSKSECLLIPNGFKGAVQKTYYSQSQTDIEVQISQLEQSQSAGECAVQVVDADGDYVTFHVGYNNSTGSTDVQMRYNNSTWVKYSAITVPTGWNDLQFVFDASGNLDLYLNDVFIDSTSALDGFSRILLMKNWTTYGMPVWDRLTITENASTSAGFCDADDHGLAVADFNMDCAVDFDDLSLFVQQWLGESITWQPATLSGTVMSVDGQKVECQIGIDIIDEQGNPRNANGSINTSPYGGNIIWHNRYVDDANDWSIPEIAIPAGETWTAWLEIYPKNDATTDLSTYMRTSWHNVPIQAGEVIDDINIELEYTTETATISGTLTNNGTPISGGELRGWCWSGVNGTFDFASTDANGNFTFNHSMGWCKDANNPETIISPVTVSIWYNGHAWKTVSVGPNDTVTGVNIDIANDTPLN